MAKKTRKVSKQQSQQRAIQQAVANVQTVDTASTAPAAAAPAVAAPAVPARTPKVDLGEAQEFAFVKSDVRRSLTLAGIFAAAMLVLSFIVR